MNRVARWRMWLGSWIMGRRPHSIRAVFIPAGTPWWKRQLYRVRPPQPPPRPPDFDARMRRFHRRVAPPEDELGVAVPVQHVLAATEASVVGLTYCVAYSTGFQLGVGIRHRREPARPAGVPHEPPEMMLVVGVRFADGRESYREGRGPTPEMRSYLEAVAAGQEPPEPPGPTIGPMSGGGGGRRWDQQYWVYPLPPDGPVTITCRWPAGGIPEGQVEIDGAAIRRAGEQSERLWTD